MSGTFYGHVIHSVDRETLSWRDVTLITVAIPNELMEMIPADLLDVTPVDNPVDNMSDQGIQLVGKRSSFR